MEWNFYSLDKKPVNYMDLSANREIATGIKVKPEISANYKIGDKIYHVGVIDIQHHYVGVNEINFVNPDDIEETLETHFTCPYCGYIYIDAFELDDEGEIECPGCDSKLQYERQITVEYAVSPIERAEVIKIEL